MIVCLSTTLRCWCALPLLLIWLFAWPSALGAKAILQVGDEAPAFELKDVRGALHKLEQTSRPLLLVFVKIEDRNTSTALGELTSLLRREPEFDAGVERWIIVTRMTDSQKLTPTLAHMPAPWQVLFDRDDETYRGYKIIATPSYVVVAPDRKVAAVHPGYDPGMMQQLRLELARILKISLSPAERGEQPEAPDMNLGMARRLAARHMWDEALDFYAKAAAHKPLAPADVLTLSQIHLEINQPAEALRLLDTLSTNTAVADKVARLRAQVLAAKDHQRVTTATLVR
jgi:peroxiredoxin